MSCYNCARSFSFLSKERGCSNCGFGFCSSCLKYKAKVPSKDKSESPVCGACFRLLTNVLKPTVRPAPDALTKRLEALEKAPANPITVYKEENTRISRLKRGLSQEDQQIAERLRRLQKERKASEDIPSELEIHDRLAKLKGAGGVPFSDSDRKNLLVKNDRRTDVERTRDLMRQAQDEVEIDSRIPKPEDDIAMRLARLRGEDYKPKDRHLPDPSKFIDSTDDNMDPVEKAETVDDLTKVLNDVALNAEEEAKKGLKDLENDKGLLDKVKCRGSNGQEESDDDEDMESRLVEQILAEAKLEDGDLEEDDAPVPDMVECQRRVLRQVGRTISEGEGSETLPWCVICNDDPRYKCDGCDGDLYCARCMRECHDQFDLKDHKYFAFR